MTSMFSYHALNNSLSLRRDGKQLLLTKGDNNRENDLVFYDGSEFLERKHIVGKVRG